MNIDDPLLEQSLYHEVFDIYIYDKGIFHLLPLEVQDIFPSEVSRFSLLLLPTAE